MGHLLYCTRYAQVRKGRKGGVGALTSQSGKGNSAETDEGEKSKIKAQRCNVRGRCFNCYHTYPTYANLYKLRTNAFRRLDLLLGQTGGQGHNELLGLLLVGNLQGIQILKGEEKRGRTSAISGAKLRAMVRLVERLSRWST
jgi:hypothetical protein